MAKLVCDRCGAPAGTCDHTGYEDYREVTGREYSFSRAMQWALIILFTIVLGLAARQLGGGAYRQRGRSQSLKIPW